MQVEPQANVACHVLRMVVVPEYANYTKIEVDCPTLADEVLASISPAAGWWRNTDELAADLHAAVREHRLSGLAVLWTYPPRTALHVPAPIEVSFEPTPLDDRRPELRGLCDVRSESVDGEDARPAPSRAWLALMSAVLVVAALALLLVAGKAFLAAWCCAIPLLAILLGGSWSWFRYRQWLLVPGGVVVRSADAIWPFFAPLRRFSPADTILLLRPLPPTRSWEAELWRDGRSVRRNVTRLECTLLLAAWQSPLSSPGLDALADLR